jgi:hypothetical protein
MVVCADCDGDGASFSAIGLSESPGVAMSSSSMVIVLRDGICM